MLEYLIYLLVPLMAILLVSAQAIWGTAIKNQKVLEGDGFINIATNLITSPRIWIGGFIYIAATIVYFIMLSRIKFFSVQISMTAASILFSTALAVLLFNEKLSLLNIMGMVLVLVALPLVLAK